METVACRDRFNKKFRRNKDNLEWLEAIVLAVVAVALIFTFGVRMIRVDGESMLPSLQHELPVYAAARGHRRD